MPQQVSQTHGVSALLPDSDYAEPESEPEKWKYAGRKENKHVAGKEQQIVYHRVHHLSGP